MHENILQSFLKAACFHSIKNMLKGLELQNDLFTIFTLTAITNGAILSDTN